MESQQEPQSKAKCKHCGRPLVAIGDKRANGKAHKDWNTRVLHKKRYREIVGDTVLKPILEDSALKTT
jgi:hypothetical protein